MSISSCRHKSLSAVFLCLITSATLSTAGFAEETEPRIFGEIIDVRVFNLEVMVTDKSGKHVTDLEPEDFVLLVDGKEVPIEYFSEIRLSTAMTPPEADFGSSEVERSPRIAAIPSVTPGETVGTSFLVFVDNFFTIPRDRKVVIQKIIDDLPNLGPQDRMAVVAFDGRNLDLVGSWASSQTTIAENLRRALAPSPGGLERLAELKLKDLELRAQGAGLIEENDFNTQVEFIRRLSQQVSTAVKAATATLRSMASPPGRKVMLLMSGGWPNEPSTYAVGLNPAIRNATKRFSPKPDFANLASTANKLGYTLFPIDAPGRGIHVRGADEDGQRLAFQAVPSTTSGNGPAGTPSLTPQASVRDLAEQEVAANLAFFDQHEGREHTLEASLIELAEETGGRALLNGFRNSALATTIQETGSYYWLGYSPTWAHDDQEHSIRIKILRPGLKSRSRRGFKDLSREAEVTMMVESNLLFSTELQGHTLGLQLGKPVKARRGKLSLPVSLKIPLDQVVMLPGADGYRAELELRVAVLDNKGERSEIPVIPVAFGGPEKPPPGAHATYDTTLMLRDIPQRVALALYDLAGEGILSTSIEIDPEAFDL